MIATATTLRLLLPLLLLLTATAPARLHAQIPGLLDNTPSFKPTIDFAESYTETVVLGTHPPQATPRYHTSLKVVANIENLAPITFDKNTVLYLSLGYLGVSFALGEDPNYRKGDTSATSREGFGNVPGAVLKLHWTDERLTITLALPPNSGWGTALARSLPGTYHEHDVALAETLYINFAGSISTRSVYVTGTFDPHLVTPAGQPAQFNRIHLTGHAEITPPTIHVTGLSPTQWTRVEGGDLLPGTVTVTDAIGLAGQDSVEVAFAPTVQELEASMRPLAVIDSHITGAWGITRLTGRADTSPLLDRPPGPSYVQFRARDTEGNVAHSEIFTVYQPIGEAERGSWAGVLNDTGELPEHRDLNGVLQFIVDARGAILSGAYRYMDHGMASGGNDGAFRRIPFTGRFGPGQIIRLPRARGPDFLLSIGDYSGDGYYRYPVTLTEEGYTTRLQYGFVYPTPYSHRNPAPSWVVNRYHLSLETVQSDPFVGLGYAAVTCAASGQVHISGHLADGSLIIATARLGMDHDVAAIAPLYRGRGSFWTHGTLGIQTLLNLNFEGAWHRPASMRSVTWPAGIHTPVNGSGRPFHPPQPGQRILGLDGTLPIAEALFGSFSSENQFHVTQPFSVSRGNHITVSSPNPRRFHITSIHPDIGLITGTFHLPGGEQPASFRALMKGDEAFGYFLSPSPNGTTPGRAGFVVLRPTVPQLDSPEQALYIAPESYTATGTTLGKLNLGFMPQPGQAVTLVSNPGDQPVTGTFKGMPEGARVPVNIGGSTIEMILSYRGGDGNDITLTWQQAAPPTQLRHVLHDQVPDIYYDSMGESTVSTGNLIIAGVPASFARGYYTGCVLIYNATTGALLHTLYPPQGIIGGSFGARLALSGRRLAVSAPDGVVPNVISQPYKERGVVLLYDLPANDTAPELIGTVRHPEPWFNTAFGRGIAFSGDSLAIGAVDASVFGPTPLHDRVFLFNVADPAQPRLTRVCASSSSNPTSGFGRYIALSSQHLIVAHQTTHIFDLSRPANPAFPDTATTTLPYCDKLTLSGTRLLMAYYTGARSTAVLADLSRPLDQLDLIPLPNPFPDAPDGSDVMATALTATRAVVAVSLPPSEDGQRLSPSRVAIYDISHPASPLLLTHVPVTAASLGYRPTSDYARPLSVTLTGSHLAVGYQGSLSNETMPDGLLLYDLAQPAARRLRKLLNYTFKYTHATLAVSPHAIALAGGSLSVPWTSDGAIHHYDLTGRTPATSDLTLQTPDSHGDKLACGGRYLVSAANQDVYDLHSPYPTLPFTRLGQRPAAGLAAAGNRIGVGDVSQSANVNGKVTIHVGPRSRSFVLTPPGTVKIPAFGARVACQGTLVAVSDDHTVWVYETASNRDSNAPILTLPAPAAVNGGEFGSAIAIAGRYIAINAPAEVIEGIPCGAVYLYDRDSATPTVPVRRWQAPTLRNDQRFGYSIALQGTRLVIGAPCDGPLVADLGQPGTEMRSHPGAAFLYDLASPAPGTPVATYGPETDIVVDGMGFGTQVLLSADVLAISAPFDDRDGWNNGAIYIYGPPEDTE